MILNIPHKIYSNLQLESDISQAAYFTSIAIFFIKKIF